MMHAIRTLFCLRTIYFKQTALQIIYFYSLVGTGGIVLVFLAAGSNNITPYHILAPLLLVAYFALRSTIRTIIVNAAVRPHRSAPHVLSPTEIATGSIGFELNSIDHLQPIAAHTNARLFLATFDFYNRTKYGTYLAKQAYYTVLEVQLSRPLPHILFDSKKAKRRQFKSLYLHAQRISVQGGFDDVFDTYAPQSYNIDTLSFVTPEVMEALVALHDYDIEIVNDKLLLYAPLLSAQERETFMHQGRTLAAHFNDNIDTYRDNRLMGQKRATDVTAFARALLRSPTKYFLSAAAASIVTGGILYATYTHPAQAKNILLHPYAILVYIFLASNLIEGIKISRTNTKALQRFQNHTTPTP